MAGGDQIRVRRVAGEAALVEISGEQDMSTAPLPTEQFDALFAEGCVVIADIRETTFLDSHVVRVFETATQRAAERPGVRFALVVDVEQSRARRIFDLLRPLTGDIPSYPSVDAALAALERRE